MLKLFISTFSSITRNIIMKFNLNLDLQISNELSASRQAALEEAFRVSSDRLAAQRAALEAIRISASKQR